MREICHECGGSHVYKVVGVWTHIRVNGKKHYYRENYMRCFDCGETYYEGKQLTENLRRGRENYLTPWKYFWRVKVKYVIDCLLYGTMVARVKDIELWED